MASGDSKLTGPDLSKGLDPGDLPEGGMLTGHAQGEAVLLVRSGGEVFAVGATCTHYGGPLGEGLVVGESVRCPWHHACFSLKTGEAIRAPALNPVACFDVEERAGKLYVLGKKPPAAAPSPPHSPRSVVIVGAGAAGNAAAEMLRQRGYRGPITLVGADPSVPYDRPNLSKDYLAGSAPEEWIPLRSPDFYREQSIDIRTGTRVARIDTGARRVHLEGGESIEYGALLLATGAEPVRLTIPGADLPHVRYLRTLADSREIIARASSAKRAVVLGASFIGLEVAASLRARGVEVQVAAPGKVPLERVMGPEIGAMVRALHEEHGVVFHMGNTAERIDEGSVTLAGGERLSADLVVAGIGVRPSLSLAEAAGLRVERGVMVDELLRTSAEGVFAAGDIARWPDARTGQPVRVEHWVVAERQGQIAARNMLGEGVRCDLAPFFWSQHYDVAISYVGHAEAWERLEIDGDLGKRDARVSFIAGGKTLAVATIGRDRESLLAEQQLEGKGGA